MRRIDRQGKEVYKIRIGCIPPFSLIGKLERVLHMTHIAGENRADARAVRKEEIDQYHLTAKRIQGDRIAELIDQPDISHLMPNRIGDLFTIFDP